MAKKSRKKKDELKPALRIELLAYNLGYVLGALSLTRVQDDLIQYGLTLEQLDKFRDASNPLARILKGVFREADDENNPTLP